MEKVRVRGKDKKGEWGKDKVRVKVKVSKGSIPECFCLLIGQTMKGFDWTYHWTVSAAVSFRIMLRMSHTTIWMSIRFLVLASVTAVDHKRVFLPPLGPE